SNDASHAAAGGKLGPKWEGPYEVTDAGKRSLQVSVNGWNDASQNLECRKPKVMLPLKIGTNTGHG
nr:hypothetical protein [Tanacetum cinerariifolium]